MPRLLSGNRASAVLLLVFSSILSATPRLVLSTSAIGPLYVTAGTNGQLQTVQASNAGDGTLTITTATSASWLAASVGAQAACVGQTGNCLPISISLNTASLAAGSYTEYVTVTAPNDIDSPQQISVNVIVAGVPASVTLYAAPNGGTASVNIYPHTAVVGAVSTQSGGVWLSFGQPTKSGFGVPYPITATSQTGQAAGTYSGAVAISGSTFLPDNQTVNVTLNVTASPIIQVNNQNLLMTGYAGGPKVTSTIAFTNQGQGTLSVTGATVFSSVNSLFTASATSANSITITADPSQASAGLYTGKVTITSNAANNAQVSIPVEFTVLAAGVPNISQGGIVNIATFLADPVSPGDIVSIFGDQFSAVGSTFTNQGAPPLATRLGGVSVLVNSVAAPLYFVSRQQINFQMPYEAPVGGASTIQVLTNSGASSNIRSAAIVSQAPRILTWPTTEVSGNYGVVVNSDNTLSLLPGAGLGPSRLSKPNDVIVIYCTGLGETTPAAVTGAPAGSNPVQSIQNVTVTFGNSTVPVAAQAVFAGLTPTAVGLYQVNVTIPTNVPIGNSVPLALNIGTISSNVVNIPIASN
jgi:uncharacterized protein (TIGR03437 family)